MKNEIQLNKSIPTIQELYLNPELAVRQESFNHYLNQQPPKTWVKEHPFIKGYRYLPIDKVEFLLRKFYKSYKIEVLKTGILLNSIEVILRVNYLDPVTNEWMHHDGVGAEELQTQKQTGSLKLDMSNLNKGAVKMALPIAKTIALKDACDHIGEIFGASLNRKDIIQFSVDSKLFEFANSKEEERLQKLIEKANDLITLDSLKTHLTDNLQSQFDLKWRQLNSSK
jgi:hypothetical protein